MPCATQSEGKSDRPKQLPQSVEQYARFRADASGHNPRSMTDVIVGVLGEYLGSDTGFATWTRENPNPDSSESPFSLKSESRLTQSDGA